MGQRLCSINFYGIMGLSIPCILETSPGIMQFQNCFSWLTSTYLFSEYLKKNIEMTVSFQNFLSRLEEPRGIYVSVTLVVGGIEQILIMSLGIGLPFFICGIIITCCRLYAVWKLNKKVTFTLTICQGLNQEKKRISRIFVLWYGYAKQCKFTCKNQYKVVAHGLFFTWKGEFSPSEAKCNGFIILIQSFNLSYILLNK